MLVDYWLVARIGRVWLRTKPGLRDDLRDLPSACQSMARGDRLPAALTWRAEEFAVRVWFRFGLSAVIAAIILGVGVSMLPSQTARNWAISVPVVLIGLMGLAGAQMALVQYRAGQARRYLQEAGDQDKGDPLPRGSLGLPTPWDFWVLLVLAGAVCAILLYASGGH
jgi:DNA-binding transcriptional LysR family regulator